MFGAKSRDQQFFTAFADHAKLSVEAAKCLVTLFEDLGTVVEQAKAIKALESQGDTITHDTVKHLHETWITPLDRSDIHELITRLDDVLDLIEAVSERTLVFRVKEVDPTALSLARVLLAACEHIARATALLPKVSDSTKELLAIAVELNRLENEADDLYRKGLGDLFNETGESSYRTMVKGALEVMKWRDIFDNLENATDKCEDVANVIEGIVLEYG